MIVVLNNEILAIGDFNRDDYGPECLFLDVEVPAEVSPLTHIWDGIGFAIRPEPVPVPATVSIEQIRAQFQAIGWSDTEIDAFLIASEQMGA